jgi:DNA-binding NtrC family response regulator
MRTRQENPEIVSDLKKSLETPELGDRTRLLKIEIYLKVYVLLLVLCGTLFLQFIGVFGYLSLPKKELAAGLVLFVALNATYLFLLNRVVHLRGLYVFVALTDILFFTIIIHFLGGADYPVLALLYVLPVPFYSILISPWSGYLVAMGSCIAYTVLCGLEYSGLLDFYGSPPIQLERVSIILFFLFFCFFSIAFYVGYFSDVLRRHQKALANANKEIEEHNLTLETRIASRTRQLEETKRKLEEYSRQLEKAYNEKSTQLEAVQKRLASELSELKLKYNYENIIGKSRQMQEVFRLMDKVTDFNVPILIEGDSGTGKELVARAIHYNGPRRDKPFIVQNCSALTDTLLESELFGHVKGAFTGALQDRKGLFEEADQGTLFLDEIGDMSPALQSKLLRAIQEGEIRPVGGKKMIRMDVRIISATNRDLKEAVQKGEFREDLYYRLNGVTIQLSPLRERRVDILDLAEHFLNNFHRETGIPVKRLSQEAKKLLLSYHWPGNVRELENTIKNAFVIAQTEEIQVEDFRYKPELFNEGLPTRSSPGRAEEQAWKKEPHPGSGDDGGVEAAQVNIKSLKEMEREAIERALARCNGRRKDASILLDIPIRTLYEKMKRYGIR